MLSETRKALRIFTTSFDDELLDLIKAGIQDVKLVGCDFPVINEASDVVINDPLVKRAVITYVKCNFGEPDKYNELRDSYDNQKAQLRENSRYVGG